MAALDAVGPWLVGLVIFGLPVALAWWLSDGFKGWKWQADPTIRPHVETRTVFNPRTNEFEVVAVNMATQPPTRFPM
jgi:hypothetical protein